jgi:hypothetical protein
MLTGRQIDGTRIVMAEEATGDCHPVLSSRLNGL